MKKSDLKTGMRVKTRDECIYLVVCDVLINGKKDILFVDKVDGWMNGSSYNDNLICNDGDEMDRDFDVMEIYTISKTQDAFQTNFMNLDIKYLIWKRKEYTEKQNEAFKALKILGFKYIAKDKSNDVVFYTNEPYKTGTKWDILDGDYSEISQLQNIFPFINWEDEEPFEIPEV